METLDISPRAESASEQDGESKQRHQSSPDQRRTAAYLPFLAQRHASDEQHRCWHKHGKTLPATLVQIGQLQNPTSKEIPQMIINPITIFFSYPPKKRSPVPSY